MDKQINYSLEQGKNSLEDLKLVVDSSCQLFVDQVIHHINELRYHLLKNPVQGAKDMTGINALLEWRIQESMKELLLETEGVSQLNFFKEAGEISLESWNRVLDSLGPVLTLAKQFSYVGNINVYFHKNSFEVSGTVRAQNYDESAKVQVYAMTRFLLAHKVILTYDIREDLAKGTQLTLKVDLSHNDNLIYLVDLKNKEKVKIGFTNCFDNYHVPQNQIMSLGRHLCLEISNDLSLMQLNEIPMRIKDMSGSVQCPTIIHFPFLFRPFSLIIPSRGQISSALQYRKRLNTGSGVNYGHGRDADSSEDCLSYVEFDFFKLAGA